MDNSRTKFTYHSDYATFLVDGLTIKIDLGDIKAVREVNWFIVDKQRQYVATYARKTDRFPGRNVMLHRYITGVSRTHQVRFRNGDPTDCRRSNLELVPIKYGRTLQQPKDACGCGVYTILNLKNSKIYVGSASRLELRWEKHIEDLRNGRGNKNLQADWDKQEAKDFYFNIIMHCSSDDLLKYEETWIKGYQKLGRELYNIHLTPHSKPYKPTANPA